MITKAYTPLAKLGKVYYIPTPKGFIYYDRRTKTALLSPSFAMKVHTKYTKTVEKAGEWELPKKEIEIKHWACNTIDTSPIAEKYEKEVFQTMGYHYVQLGRPKNFWFGLLNLDKRFWLYTIPELKIDPEGSIFHENPPFSFDDLFKKLPRLKGTYLTENLISGHRKNTTVVNK